MKNRSALFSLSLVILMLSLFLQSCLASPNVGYRKAKIAGVWVHVVTADLNDPTVCVTPAVAKRGIGTTESFRSMIRRTRPIAAIDGTFFCTRTLRPTGDIVIDGQLVYRGYLGIAVAFGECNSVRFVDCQTYRWADYRSVLVAGPSLLLDGKMAVYPRDQGFRSGVHFSRRIRTGIGVTRANKLVLVTTLRSVYLGQFARVMRALGCVDAAGLDGGSSTGLYWNGKLISNPSRGMTNCLLVYNDPSSYQRHKESLYPANRYTKRLTDIP